MLQQIIDRRLAGKNKSVGNRERFLRRYKEQIKEAVKRAIDGRGIRDRRVNSGRNGRRRRKFRARIVRCHRRHQNDRGAGPTYHCVFSCCFACSRFKSTCSTLTTGLDRI